MEKNLLLVDDYLEDPDYSGWGRTNGIIPNDEQHDAFWANALINLADFNPSIDAVTVARNKPLPIFTLAQYRTLIWDTYGGYSTLESSLPFLYDVIKFLPKDPEINIVGRVQPNLLALFLAAGGHLLLCGEQPMTMVFNQQFTNSKRFPFIFQYELLGDQDGNYNDQVDDPVGDQSFAYRDMCLDVLDIAYTGWGSLRRPGDNENGCGVPGSRTVSAIQDGLVECLPADPNFPHLTLRPECGGPGKYYSDKGLNNELYNPEYFNCGQLDLGPRSVPNVLPEDACFEPIYLHVCNNMNSVLYNAPIAGWTNVFADIIPDWNGVDGPPARSAIFGFEPAYFDTTLVRQALEYIIFDEWKLPRK
jgi:hypothetical protein